MERENEEMTAVLRQMCAGSVEAFDRFYQRYAGLVYHIALHHLGDRMEAEDACHDLFLEVLRKGGRYDPQRGTVEGWLAVMARSRCLDRLRRRQRIVLRPVDERRQAADALPEERVLRRLQRDAAVEALRRLPGAQRQVLVAAYSESRTQKEIATAWKVPLGTVKSWMRYGIKNMRKQLSQHGWIERERGEEQ
ncbi:sigma-70 family RNA polymerase sigma factor [Paenibacillus sp. IB182496]|uniref:Sigma-70 family RNA polymerase sigma factor n=1 Tax=Paenibacillus sabuli TaxID=2772509 RepID=A0A927GTP4_9BACL|nr:sigma-70 family RNA polymerase sigma factor [Paenibacillus sabuli]MBD2847320.1 sigma-70 family RNA polymerase sigma factor [Paenibacillus sabuli]